jgi:hypothetical protein
MANQQSLFSNHKLTDRNIGAKKPLRPMCSVAGCQSRRVRKTFCTKHFNESNGAPEPAYKRPCTVSGCQNKQRARGFCGNHWKKWRKFGDANAKRKRDPGSGSINYCGYKLLYMPDDPNADVNGHVREHRMVMSKKLGRPLLPGENVHHINGNRLDNRVENLELWVKTQPSGQRADQLLAWAREIIGRYEGTPVDATGPLGGRRITLDK